jgi:hypothetical protein
MTGWLGNLGWVALIIGLAVLGGVFGRGAGRSVRRGMGLAGMVLLGFGHVIDPPAVQATEAAEDERDDSGTPSGDPDET